MVSSIRKRGSPDALGLANEALVDERGERGEEIELVACLHQDSARRGSSRRRTPQSTKQHLFAGREQVVAPGNGIAQRLLPRGQIAGTTGEQRQAPLEPLQQRRWRQHLDARAASSIASGNPSRRAQMPATAAALSAVSAKSGLRACPRDEEANGIKRPRCSRLGSWVGSGTARGLHQFLFRRQRQPRATCRQNA